MSPEMPSVTDSQDALSPAARRRVGASILHLVTANRPLDEPMPDITSGIIPSQRPSRRLWRLSTRLGIAALSLCLLGVFLIIGARPMSIPGLRSNEHSFAIDTAPYNFEHDAQEWRVRGVATNAVSNDTHVFAGRRALKFQVAGLLGTKPALVYTDTVKAKAKPGAWVAAYVYVPAGAPPLLGTVYILDHAWGWHNGPFPMLYPGQWTAITYQIPLNTGEPIHELGVMIICAHGAKYTGPLFLDSVEVQNW